VPGEEEHQTDQHSVQPGRSRSEEAAAEHQAVELLVSGVQCFQQRPRYWKKLLYLRHQSPGKQQVFCCFFVCCCPIGFVKKKVISPSPSTKDQCTLLLTGTLAGGGGEGNSSLTLTPAAFSLDNDDDDALPAAFRLVFDSLVVVLAIGVTK